MTRIFTEHQLAILQQIAEFGSAQGTDVFLVGGVLRDTLLGRTSLDFDLMIEGDGINFARGLTSKMSLEIKEHLPFLTAKLTGFGNEIQEIDIATAREENYPVPGSLPVVKSSTLERDVLRRDFTINTLRCRLSDMIAAVRENRDIRGIISDPMGGLADLDGKLIRILHPDSFVDDPTRIFRGARYAARLGGVFEPFTYERARLAITKGALSTISYYRIGNELRWILAEENAVGALGILKDLNVFEWIQFGPPPNLEVVVTKMRELQDRAPKVNREFSRMEIPVFVLLMSCNISTEARAQLFLEWGFGKRGVARAEEALKECGVSAPGVCL